MKRKDVLSCLPKSKKIFDIEMIRTNLMKKGFVKETRGKKIYRLMESLVKENFLEKIDSRHYRVIDVTDKLDLAKYLIKNNQEKGLVVEWDSGSGFFGKPRGEGIFLGVPKNYKFKEEWKGLFYSILKKRIAHLSYAMAGLLTSVDKMPIHGSDYVRETVLESISLYLGHLAGEDHDGLDETSLITLIESLTKNDEFRNVVHVEDLEQLEHILNHAKESLQNYTSKSKRPENFGMVIFPGTYTIDPEMPHERDVLEFMGSDLKNNKNAERIVANLSTWYYPEEVGRIFRKYDGYYSVNITTKIRELHDKVETGFVVTFCLYDIDHCLKIIDLLESKKLHVGYYDDDGHYVGKENTTDIGFGDGGFYVNGGTVGPSRFISKARQIKRKAFYVDILNKTTDKLKEIFRQKGIEQCITNATFASEIKLTSSPRFVIVDMNWKRILKDMGYSPTEDQIQEWIEKGKEEAKQFVKKWLKQDRMD
jgi:hypothetical protein